MASLIVFGGRLRHIAGGLHREVGAIYSHAILAEVDLKTNKVTRRLEWRDEEWEAVPDISHVFKGASWHGDKLLLCTERNLLWVDPKTWEVTRQWSHIALNDVHHAAWLNGKLHIAVSGLDAVLVVHAEHQIVIRSVLGKRMEMPWTDQRCLDLAPHYAHPNHLFEWQGDVWATRFQSCDAVTFLGKRQRNLHLGRVPVHDGLVAGEGIFFTSVDGRLLYTGKHGLQTHKLGGPDKKEEPLGWCRGVALDSPHTAWVGFSRIRASRFREHLAWAGHSLDGTLFETRRPTRLQQHDLHSGGLMDTVDLEGVGIDAVFGILYRPDH